MRPVDLARAVNISSASVRFYEREGILPAAERRPSGHRHYTGQHLAALKTARTMMSGYGWANTRNFMRLIHRGEIDTALTLVDARHAENHQERLTLADIIAVLSQLETAAAMLGHRTTLMPARIGVAAKLVGATVPTLRFWEASGLIQSTRDPSSNFRIFGVSELERLRLVATLRRAAYGIDQIRRVVTALRNNNPAAALEEARKREATLREITRSSMEATSSLWAYIEKFAFVHPVDKMNQPPDDDAV